MKYRIMVDGSLQDGFVSCNSMTNTIVNGPLKDCYKFDSWNAALTHYAWMAVHFPTWFELVGYTIVPVWVYSGIPVYTYKEFNKRAWFHRLAVNRYDLCFTISKHVFVVNSRPPLK